VSDEPIRFLFDYISPNAYLAWEGIGALAARVDRVVEPVPVLFAGLLNAHKAIGPAEVRAKWRWMTQDLLRKSSRLGIPLEPPHSHPFNPLLALRVTTLPMAADTRHRLIGAIFQAAWVRGADVTDAQVVAAIASEVGLDGPRVIEQAGSSANKRILRSQTDEAAAEGVFGVPTMRVDGQLFWGFDDFGALERFLSGEEPAVDPASMQRWEGVSPSADRRG